MQKSERTGDWLPEEQSQAAKVSVALDPDIVELVIFLFSTVVIFHVPQMAIALFRIPMTFEEICLGQLEYNCEEYQELRHDIFPDMSSEPFNLGPMLFYECRVRSFIFWYELWYIIDFGIVELARSNLPQSERLVAVVSSMLEVSSIL